VEAEAAPEAMSEEPVAPETVAHAKTVAPETVAHAKTMTASEAAAMAIPGVDGRDHQAIGRQQHQEYHRRCD